MTKYAALRIRPVLLSGGAGPRFWPVSRALNPRQFQRFSGAHSMLQDTALRVKEARLSAPVVICHHEHRFLVAEQLAEIGETPGEIILEAECLNTAPAILTAAIWLHTLDPAELMLVMPCDHFMPNADAFCKSMLDAAGDAHQGRIVALGVEATDANPEFGYIQPGDGNLLCSSGAAPISRFVEKPDTATAAKLINDGYYWNSGIYILNPGMIIDEYAKRAPDLLAACQAALDQGKRDLDFLRLAAEPMTSVPAQSFNKLIMETTDNAVMRLLSAGWRNVHSWRAFHNGEKSDADGNVVHGDSIVVNSRDSLIHTDCMLTALIGVNNIAAIATDDAILVTDIRHSDQIHGIVGKIEASGRTQHLVHSTRHQPWGSAKNILSSAGFRVNELMVSPGKELSLQRHRHRAEHWVVVEGTAEVRCDEKEFLLRENESTYVPSGSLHKLSNPGRIPLRIIEIQSGEYLGDDDIVRSDAIGELHLA